MDKQYKLTDRVSKDSINSPIFKKWVKRILCIACILSLALQLTLCCLPMKASAVESDSIEGTWYFNDVLINSGFSESSSYMIYFDFESNGTSYACLHLGTYATNISLNYYVEGLTSVSTVYIGKYTQKWQNVNYRTITITSDVATLNGEDVTSTLYTWLSANATKVITDIYDFTGETRIFNDELTLFNTADATWVYSSNFNFEVLGVGSADYIILQRTAQNNYTMSYSFDFEGSGGLTMIYRDTPPFNDDAAEWLGGKVNRKVITFLSNPDDPEFQQWLLDNTTLFDNVNDAYDLGLQSGYNNGYEEGFANSLIGDTLSGPINALSQITLIEIQGTAITLGGVVMTAIALCLVLAFLKLYAGG